MNCHWRWLIMWVLCCTLRWVVWLSWSLCWIWMSSGKNWSCRCLWWWCGLTDSHLLCGWWIRKCLRCNSMNRVGGLIWCRLILRWVHGWSCKLLFLWRVELLSWSSMSLWWVVLRLMRSHCLHRDRIWLRGSHWMTGRWQLLWRNWFWLWDNIRWRWHGLCYCLWWVGLCRDDSCIRWRIWYSSHGGIGQLWLVTRLYHCRLQRVSSTRIWHHSWLVDNRTLRLWLRQVMLGMCWGSLYLWLWGYNWRCLWQWWWLWLGRWRGWLWICWMWFGLFILSHWGIQIVYAWNLFKNSSPRNSLILHSLGTWNSIHWKVMYNWCGRRCRSLCWCGFFPLNEMCWWIRSWNIISRRHIAAIFLVSMMHWSSWNWATFIWINNVHFLADRMNFHDLDIV